MFKWTQYLTFSNTDIFGQSLGKIFSKQEKVLPLIFFKEQDIYGGMSNNYIYVSLQSWVKRISKVYQ